LLGNTSSLFPPDSIFASFWNLNLSTSSLILLGEEAWAMRLAKNNPGPIPVDKPLSAPVNQAVRAAHPSDEEVISPARSLQTLLEGQMAQDPFSGPSPRDLKRAAVLAFGLLAAAIICLAFWLLVLKSTFDLLGIA